MKTGLLTAIAAIALVSTSAPAAKPKRTVVLLDFSRSAQLEPGAEPSALSSPDLDAMSSAMVRQFTGGSDTGVSEFPAWAQPQPAVGRTSPTSLGNPFVTYSLSRQPYAPALARLPINPLECAAPAYRPSYGFGRSAEERRRVIFPLVQQAACEHGLPVGLFDALIMQESRYQATALSPKGAVGLAQLMPGTARTLGVDAYTLADNLRGGARYLKQQFNRFGRYDLALAAYNSGPGRVQKRWAVPQIAETQGYVRTIMANWTGASTVAATVPSPMPYRQAQLIFMPASVRSRND